MTPLTIPCLHNMGSLSSYNKSKVGSKENINWEGKNEAIFVHRCPGTNQQL